MKYIGNIHRLKTGDKALMKHTASDNEEWREFIVNETYLPLIAKFPEDYKPMPQNTLKY